MINKFNKGVVDCVEDGKKTELEEKYEELYRETLESFEKHMSKLEFNKALEKVWEFIDFLNKYIVKTEPWKLNKEKSPYLKTVLYVLADGLLLIGYLLYPFMPVKMKTLLEYIGFEYLPEDIYPFSYPSGSVVKKKIKPLFPRLEDKGDVKVVEKKEDKKEEFVSIEDFAKLQFKVGEILEAEKVEKSNKLLKLLVDLGDEKRTIVSGIAEYYKPNELIGKKVIVFTNLKPRKIFGIQSQGMILASKDDKGLKLLTVDGDIKNGSLVS